MNRQKDKNLNHFISELPVKTVLPSDWLGLQGISRQLIWAYVKSGWLRQLASKAYCRTDTPVTWLGAVYALEFYLKLPIHIGGKAALGLLGRGHFVPVSGLRSIDLFKTQNCHVPRWLSQIEETETEFHLFNSQLFNAGNADGIIEKEIEGVNVKLSAPERAILEVLYLVPAKQGYEEALLLMEGLVDLRPKLVNTLLQQCQSIKTKRLFLHMADKCAHPWLKKIDLGLVDLGSGKRQIGDGGVYDNKYQISVPKIRSE